LELEIIGKDKVDEVRRQTWFRRLDEKTKMLQVANAEIKGLKDGIAYLEDELHRADAALEVSKRKEGHLTRKPPPSP